MTGDRSKTIWASKSKIVPTFLQNSLQREEGPSSSRYMNGM